MTTPAATSGPSTVDETAVGQAVAFLAHPKTQATSLADRVAFLKQKGLSDASINVALQRSGLPLMNDQKAPAETRPGLFDRFWKPLALGGAAVLAVGGITGVQPVDVINSLSGRRSAAAAAAAAAATEAAAAHEARRAKMESQMEELAALTSQLAQQQQQRMRELEQDVEKQASMAKQAAGAAAAQQGLMTEMVAQIAALKGSHAEANERLADQVREVLAKELDPLAGRAVGNTTESGSAGEAAVGEGAAGSCLDGSEAVPGRGGGRDEGDGVGGDDGAGATEAGAEGRCDVTDDGLWAEVRADWAIGRSLPCEGGEVSPPDAAATAPGGVAAAVEHTAAPVSASPPPPAAPTIRALAPVTPNAPETPTAPGVAVVPAKPAPSSVASAASAAVPAAAAAMTGSADSPPLDPPPFDPAAASLGPDPPADTAATSPSAASPTATVIAPPATPDFSSVMKMVQVGGCAARGRGALWGAGRQRGWRDNVGGGTMFLALTLTLTLSRPRSRRTHTLTTSDRGQYLTATPYLPHHPLHACYSSFDPTPTFRRPSPAPPS